MGNFFTRTLNGLILAGLCSLPSTSAVYAQQNSDSPELFMQTGHTGVIRSLDISSDGKLQPPVPTTLPYGFGVCRRALNCDGWRRVLESTRLHFRPMVTVSQHCRTKM